MSQGQPPPTPLSERLATRAKAGVRSAARTLARAARVPVRERAALAPIGGHGQERIKDFFARPKFFIIGYPRSGTTLLARLVRLHPEVCCLWQAHFFSEHLSLTSALATRELEDWLRRPDNRWVDDEEGVALTLRAVCDFLMETEARARGKRIVGDKSPASDWRRALPDLAKVYPDAAVIHIVRDGRAVAVSRRVQHFIDQPHLLGREGERIRRQLKQEGVEYLRKGRSIFSRARLAKEAWAWSTEVTEVDRIGRELYGDQYHAVRYEDLLQDPQEQLSRLWRGLQVTPGSVTAGLLQDVGRELAENPAAEWHEQADPDLARLFERGTAGGWKRLFDPQAEVTFLKYARHGLMQWGYRTESGAE